AQLRQHVALLSTSADPVIVAGDFNIAPADLDVYDPAKFVGQTHTSPPERALLGELLDWGLVDLFRQHHTDGKLYSWWDYRAGDFHQGRGLRIDLVLGSASIADRCRWSVIDRNARKGQMPSDHAPVIVELDSTVGSGFSRAAACGVTPRRSASSSVFAGGRSNRPRSTKSLQMVAS